MKCRKWWKKLFLGLFDITLANSFVLYRHFHKGADHVNFVRELAMSMIEYGNNQADAQGSLGACTIIKFKKYTVKEGKNRGMRQFKTVQCVWCTTRRKRVRTSTGCPKCGVGLCAGCWHAYHSAPVSARPKPQRKRKLDFEVQRAHVRRGGRSN